MNETMEQSSKRIHVENNNDTKLMCTYVSNSKIISIYYIYKDEFIEGIEVKQTITDKSYKIESYRIIDKIKTCQIYFDHSTMLTSINCNNYIKIIYTSEPKSILSFRDGELKCTILW